ncbi:MAG: DUF2087 domain-containing protein, partial [Clostridia bacterium]|nr:DUF2087 domain-containing protein [Clostridia bacterium]
MAISQYLDSEGRVKTWPSKHEQKMSIRRTIASKFEHGRFYTEKEVNALINEWHSFNDYFLLRRELVNYGFLERTRSGSQYWKGDISPEKALETETLIIRTAVPDDAEALKKIYMSCAYMAECTGQKHDETDIDHSISEGELPPDGHKEFYRFKAIVEKQTGYIVGILEYYLG